MSSSNFVLWMRQEWAIIITPGAFMAPWPHQPCPHPSCGQQLRDLLAEMVANADQGTPEFRALIGQTPGGAITCPYCQRAVEYGVDGQSLAISARTPLRYSRTKMELRAR